jgi:inner membrane protein
MISANIPDLDVLVFATDTSPVSFRRGWTHGIAAQLVLPIVLTAAFWLLERGRPRADGTPPFRAGWMLMLSYVGVYSHVFLDYLNNYGVRLLTPFDWRWVYGDAVFIIDPWLWLALGSGVWLARHRQSPAWARRALVVASIYIAAMVFSARVARGIVEAQWVDDHGARPRALMVGPQPVSPWTRDVIIDAGDHYVRGTFSWPSRLELSPEHIPKNDHRPEVAAARADPGVRGLLVWSRFPYWILEDAEGGTLVTLIDARFMARGAFSASTIVPSRGSSSD